MPFVLFICTANQFRSPLAAALLRKEISTEIDLSEWVVTSAGTWTENGMPIVAVTRQFAQQLNLEGLEGQVTRLVDKDLLDAADLIIVMESNHKEALGSEFPETAARIFLLTDIAGGKDYDIPDPASSTTNAEEVAAELSRLIKTGKPNIVRLARSFSENRSGRSYRHSCG